MINEVRWHQRLQNFEKALGQLTEFVELPSLNKFEKQGFVQCFEYTFELAWKTLKDFLESQGHVINSPRMAIQVSFQSQLIEDGHAWLEALQKRNLMAHTYSEELIEEAERLIRYEYYPLLQDVFKALMERK